MAIARILVLALLPAGLLLPGCQGGRGAPEFGHADRAPTRTIAGERVELDRYGGDWEAVAEAPSQDRPTLDRIWSALESAGIPATSAAYGPMQRIKVPGPHAVAARRMLLGVIGTGAPGGARILRR